MKIIILILVVILLMGCATFKKYDIEPSQIETIESNAELKLIAVFTLFFGSFIYNEVK